MHGRQAVGTAGGLALGLGLVIGAVAAPDPDGRYTPEQRNYAIGHDLGVQARASMTEDGLEIRPDALIRGFSDALRGADPELDKVDMEQALAQIEREVLSRLAEERIERDPVFAARAAANLRRSLEFHEAFGEMDNVTTLPSGVQYRVLEEGEGERPGDDDVVLLSFKAKLVDGTDAFEDTQRELRVGGIVPGGRDAVRRMREGARWVIAIPPDLAFGPGGRSPNIGPNESLIVDLRLVEIK